MPSQVSCNLCGSTVPSLDYSAHFKKQHMSRPICPKCKRDFSYGNISRHLKLCNGSAAPLRYTHFYTELEDTSSSFVSCKLCEEQLVQKNSYRSHFNRFHRPSYECPTCRKTFRHKRSLDYHTKSVHDGQMKTHECPTCKKTFMLKRSLAKHMKRGHEEVNKTFECPTCKKTLRYKRNMDEHIKKVHKGVKATCPKCWNEFKYVKMHMKTCAGGSKKYIRAQLIIEAISKSEEEKSTASGIHSYITQNYPSYKINKSIICSVLSSKK